MLDLKRIRKELRKTQAEMAEVLSLSQSAYSKLERGEWNTSPRKEDEIEMTIKRLKPSLKIDEYQNDNRVNIVYGVSGKVGKVEKFMVKSQDSPLYDIIDRQESQIKMQCDLIKQLQAAIENLSKTIEKQNDIIFNLSK